MCLFRKNKNKIGENVVYKLVKILIYWSKDREVGYLLMVFVFWG